MKKRITSILLTFTLLISSAVGVAAQESVNPVASRPDMICPGCGAIGFPTGLVIPMSADEESESEDISLIEIPVEKRFLALYQEYQCSKNPSHKWYVYLCDATT